MQEHKYPIKQWAKDDRPREKLLSLGAENLSHSELIAILIHNGTRQKSALDVAQEVMKLGQDNISQLGKLSIHDLMQIKGIGEAKAITLVAALELGRRRQAGNIPDRPVIQSSADVAVYLQAHLGDRQEEVFLILFLNRANKLIGMEQISQGGLTGTVADPRIILRKALEKKATGIILCHNHPSGNLKPSQADIDLTKKIKDASTLLDIRCLDHIIVSDQGYYSFADEGLL